MPQLAYVPGRGLVHFSDVCSREALDDAIMRLVQCDDETYAALVQTLEWTDPQTGVTTGPLAWYVDSPPDTVDKSRVLAIAARALDSDTELRRAWFLRNGYPFVTVPGVDTAPYRCVSCGDPLAAGIVLARCVACERAMIAVVFDEDADVTLPVKH